MTAHGGVIWRFGELSFGGRPKVCYRRRVNFIRVPLFSLAFLFITSSLSASPGAQPAKEIVISVKRQTMTVLQGGARRAEFPISTSKFGVGDRARSYRTPLGAFRIERKVGANLPSGAVFKGLHFTGEVVAANSPGRDPIVTRVLCLGGGSAGSRGIYIHGTPQERAIGRPASYGCIRMRSRDVIALFDTVQVGTRVVITDAPRAHYAANTVTDSRGTEWYR
jgi:lipoprotein-anchoring transpeptidase ErfK/SrfK